MSGFVDEEADVSSGDDHEYTAEERKKLKKLKKRVASDSSDEEEEDDEERIREENRGFINDDEEEDQDDASGSDSESGRKRRRDDDDDVDDDVDDDDLDLIEENIGVKIDRKKKFKRLKRVVDEDSDEDADADGRTKIAHELFRGSDDEEGSGSPASRALASAVPTAEDASGEEDYEESDEGDFIVDDEGKPIQRAKKKTIYEDENLAAAQDIFGCQFDYKEFEQYGDDVEVGDEDDRDDEDEDDEYDDEEYEDMDEEEREELAARRESRKKRKEKMRQPRKTIRDVFEPFELERGFLTDRDTAIKETDKPERFMLRQIPVTSTRLNLEDRSEDPLLMQEAKWIFQHAFYRPTISRQDTFDDICDVPRRGDDRYRHRRDREILNRDVIISRIYNALDLIRNHHLEVPFIAFYRKEEVQPELKIHHLWNIFHYDEKFCQLEQRKQGLQALLKRYQDYQMESLMSRPLDAPLPDDTRVLQQHEISRVSEVEISEQFSDCYKHYLLYYGRDSGKLHEFLLRKKREERMARRKTVTRIVKVKRTVRRKKKKKMRAVIDDDDDDLPTVTQRRSRTLSKSVSRSPSPSKSRSRSRSLSKSKSRSRSRSRDRSKSRSRSRSSSRKKSLSKSRSRSRSRSQSRPRSRSKSQSRCRSKSRSRSKSLSRSRSRSKSVSPLQRRSASKSRSRSRSKSQSRDRSESRSPLHSESAPAAGSESPSPAGSRVSSPRQSSASSPSKSRGSSPRESPQKCPSPAVNGIGGSGDDEQDNKSEGYQSGNEADMNDAEVSASKPGGQSKDSTVAASPTAVNGVMRSNEEREKKSYQSPKSGDDTDSEEEVETEVETEVEEEVFDAEDDECKEHESENLKKAIRRPEYELLRKAGIEPLTKQFGLTAEQFGVNLRDNYQVHDVEQFPTEPLKEAENYISKMCTSSTYVLEAAVRMVGWQLACEPLVRKTVREVYFERARLSVTPTEQGKKLIDEHHPLYCMKYIKDKPVDDLHNEQYLKLKSGVDDKLIVCEFSDEIRGNTSINYLDEMKQLYYRDEFSSAVQDWNDLRSRAVEFAYRKILVDLKRELHERLLAEAKNYVLYRCCSKLHDWLKVAPYSHGDFAEEDEDEWDTSKGFRVLAFAYVPDPTQASFAAVIDVDGSVLEYKRLTNMLKRKDAYDERHAEMKEKDLQELGSLILRRRPHVIAVGGESKEALMILADIRELLNTMEEQEEQFPKINVELLDNSLATLYANSKKGVVDFPDYPELLRQAISLARRLKDPLLEFSQLCNVDDELLNLRFHPLQDLLNQQELLSHLCIEFVNRTNEVGLDLNLVKKCPYTQNLVQFLCGFGPRKASQMIKQLKVSKQRLENRNQLVLNFRMGPKVYVNIAGFVKIDTTAFGDSETYIEVLDSTRIHPEAYDWARKMAIDALDCEDKPAEALDEILDCPEKLNELDLEAFAEELQNQGYGLKNITLYDIRHELNHRYKDFRTAFESPTAEEVFNMLTKESPETLYVGKLVQCTVLRFIHRKPRGEQLDSANPVRNDESGLWKCPFCMKSDFPELSDVWNHFDAGDCPGQAVGIRVKVDNNITGFISVKNLSDRPVTNPAERVRKYGLIHARIIKIDPERFSVDLTSRTSDLQDRDGTWKPPKDGYYDYDKEKEDLQQNQKKQDKKSHTYQKRVIAHPSFHNIGYLEADNKLAEMDQGEAIIRPSSKGSDHLTVSWKVTDGVYQHIDVIEQDKRNHFSLGKKLWIGNQEFEDLDEILARYVSPLANNVRQILDYKYYKDSVLGSKEKALEYLKREKEKNPKSIPYIFSAIKTFPGKFMLSYMPRAKAISEFVTVLHDGFKFRKKHTFSSLADLLKWFKSNFRNVSAGPIGGATPGRMSSRTPYMGGTTPSIMGTPSLHKTVPAQVHSMATPYSIATPSSNFTPYSNYAQTPYTPSGQTPFMTPYATTPGPSATPRYGGITPNPSLHIVPPSVSHHPPGSYSRPNTPGGRVPSYQPGYNTIAPASRTPSHRTEQHDWTKAAEAWANKVGRSGSEIGPITPRYGRRDEGGRTPRYDAIHRYNPYQHDYDASRSTPRSTPKTINSPTNMSIGGDQTPLIDE